MASSEAPSARKSAAERSKTDASALAGRVLRLERRVRQTTSRQTLGFVIVNDTLAVVPYRQAALWCREPGSSRGRIEALSGVSDPLRSGVFAEWLEPMLARTADAMGEKPAATIIPDKGEAARWKEYLPARGILVRIPLQSLEGVPVFEACVAFFREAPWTREEASLLAQLAELYAWSWQNTASGTRSWEGKKDAVCIGALRRILRRRAVQLAAAAVAAGICFCPVSQSVLAPAEVAATAPFSVRAPLQGVVERVLVKPNALVKKGDLLAQMDVQELRARLEASRQVQSVAAAELRQGRQQALFDERSKMGLGVLESRAEQAASEVKYLERELAKTAIRAPRDGVAVLSDADEWQGRPAALGERILTIADPAKTEIEFNIAASDAVSLGPGAEVRFFLNAEPTAPVKAAVAYIAYRAAPVADGTLAYRGRAKLVDEADARRLQIGLKGTAKIYGEKTVLIAYLLRRPLASVRLWLGL